MDISGNFVYDDNYWKRWVSAIEGNTITLVAATGEVAIQPNTWALVHVRYGAATEAGLYDFVYITAVEDDTKLTLIRAPVSVQNGHILNATSVSIHACISDKQVNITQGSIVTSNNLVGGSAGGIIPIICEELNLDGVINVTGKGYRGGAAATALSQVGMRGEYYAGGWNSRSTAQQGNGGGGGRNNFNDGYIVGTPGGGGANATAGGAGTTGGAGGTAYPSLSAYRAPFGGGGGAGGSDNGRTSSGKGGNGGGVIVILTKQLNVGADGKLVANGENGITALSESGAGAGGAGGTIVVIKESGDTPSMEVTGGVRASNIGYPGKNYYSGAGGSGKSYVVRLRDVAGITGSSLYIDGLTISPTTISGEDITITGDIPDNSPIRHKVLLNSVDVDWSAYRNPSTLNETIFYDSEKYQLGNGNFVEVFAESADGRSGYLFSPINVINDLPAIEIHEQGLNVRVIINDRDKVKYRVLVNGVQEYPYMGAVPQDIIIDNDSAEGFSLVNSWTKTSEGAVGQSPFSGASFHYAAKDTGASATYVPEIPVFGQYKVYMMWPSHYNRATNTPIDISFVGGKETLVVNQQVNGGLWNLIGTYIFDVGTVGSVKIRSDGANGYVIADAIRFEYVPPFADMGETPIVWEKQYLSTQVNIDADNVVEVTAIDSYGDQSVKSFTFVGKYAGLIFSDVNGEYYSDDFGNVLRYLEVGVLIVGQVSQTYPILLTNKTSNALTNVLLTPNNKTLPEGVNLEISKIEDPFTPQDSLFYTEMLNYDEAVPFFARIVTAHTARTGYGEFDILVKGDPA
ncbi:golvesin C-terminal-like domain-containing protein [Paenibacillus amylolyticus]|uniref:Concanavalin A-like lectin/glucanase n=1 Tax=Paenibacillus amylolyticus TaxID=1451 RepID=A0A117I3D1_PAEAM|nr:hypothetical protein [Paenibacillus amylolyticus]GAS85160.1 concanavalin A-like lectin/glucanase [Paenibacillus amylolyticus]